MAVSARTALISGVGLVTVAVVWWFTEPLPQTVEVTRRSANSVVESAQSRNRSGATLTKPSPDETTMPSDESVVENELSDSASGLPAVPRGTADAFSVVRPSAVPTLEPGSPSDENVIAEAPKRNDPNPAPTLSHLMPGTSNHAARFRVGDLQDLSEEPTTTPTASEEKPLTLVGGQARGFTMMYLMHPKARQTVDLQVETLIKANVRDQYLAILIDGTFSLDFNYANSIIRKLSRPGHNLTLVIYLTNGSSMRRFEQGAVAAGFNLINPTDFRLLIVFDAKIRSEFLSIARQARALFALNSELSADNSNIAIMMLEDNLDVTSYSEMRGLAKRVLPATVEFMRNPCPRCWDGNDTDPLGDSLEVHDPDLIGRLNRRDGFNIDGFGYSFPSEGATTQLSFDQVKNLLSIAAQRQIRFFGLWRAQRQGIGVQGMIDPDQREYEVPTEQMQQSEIELLREGLDVVE